MAEYEKNAEKAEKKTGLFEIEGQKNNKCEAAGIQNNKPVKASVRSEDSVCRVVSGGRPYSFDYILSKEGEGLSYHDISLKEWRMTIPLEESRMWFLSVFVDENGNLLKYSLDEEAADDSHYEFCNEAGLREAIYAEGDENLFLADVMIRYIKENGAYKLKSALSPFITQAYHFY